MRAGWGLQAKMTASDVLVTAAAVALVEVVLLVVVVPGLVSRADAATLVERTAQDYAGRVMVLSAGSDRLPTADELQLGERGLELRAGEGLAAEDRETVRIPYQTTARDDARPVSLALLLAPDGRIVASSYPARYKVGARIGDPGVGPLSRGGPRHRVAGLDQGHRLRRVPDRERGRALGDDPGAARRPARQDDRQAGGRELFGGWSLTIIERMI
jgi:hypothetical protein